MSEQNQVVTGTPDVSAPTALNSGVSPGSVSNSPSAVDENTTPGGTTLNKGADPLTGIDESWKSSISEDLRNDPSFKNIKTLNDLVKTHISAQKMIGADKIVIPKTVTEKELFEISKKLGNPETFDKYDVKTPEGMQKDAPFIKGLLEAAHKNGVHPKQMENLLSAYDSAQKKAIEEFKVSEKRMADEAIGKIKSEWGQAYEKNISLSQEGLRSVLGKEQAESIINDPVLGNHPAFIRLAHKLGTLVGEDKLRGDFPSGSNIMSPMDAQKQINSIRADSAHAFNNAQHPDHKRAVEEVRGLYGMLAKK